MGKALLLIGWLMLYAVAPALPEERSTLIAHGQQFFFAQGCHGCHTVGKMGTPLGPDLSQVGRQYSHSYLTGWLRDPASQKRPVHMPRIELIPDEIQALAAYLSSLQ